MVPDGDNEEEKIKKEQTTPLDVSQETLVDLEKNIAEEQSEKIPEPPPLPTPTENIKNKDKPKSLEIKEAPEQSKPPGFNMAKSAFYQKYSEAHQQETQEQSRNFLFKVKVEQLKGIDAKQYLIRRQQDIEAEKNKNEFYQRLYKGVEITSPILKSKTKRDSKEKDKKEDNIETYESSITRDGKAIVDINATTDGSTSSFSFSLKSDKPEDIRVMMAEVKQCIGVKNIKSISISNVKPKNIAQALKVAEEAMRAGIMFEFKPKPDLDAEGITTEDKEYYEKFIEIRNESFDSKGKLRDRSGKHMMKRLNDLYQQREEKLEKKENLTVTSTNPSTPDGSPTPIKLTPQNK